MKKILVIIMFVVGIFCLSSLNALAAAPKTYTGIVTKISGSQVYFKTTSAVVYGAEVGMIPLVRRYGTAMQFSEILVGDKIEVQGKLWSDNSISATSFKNVSLYTHNGTLTGKIDAANPLISTLYITSTDGPHIIHTDAATLIKINGSAGTLVGIPAGSRVTAKASWERSNKEVVAKEIQITIRLVGIDVTGQVVMKNGNAITVVSSGVMYALDMTGTKITKKNGKVLAPGLVNLNDTVRVVGKHISGQTQITPTSIKDLSILK